MHILPATAMHSLLVYLLPCAMHSLLVYLLPCAMHSLLVYCALFNAYTTCHCISLPSCVLCSLLMHLIPITIALPSRTFTPFLCIVLPFNAHTTYHCIALLLVHLLPAMYNPLSSSLLVSLLKHSLSVIS